MQCHVCHRALGTDPGEPDDSRIAFERHELDIAAIGPEIRTNPIENGFNAVFRHHCRLLVLCCRKYGNECATTVT